MTLALRPLAARRAKIGAIGTDVPPRLLTDKDLEKMVETSDEWIYSPVGIRGRHLVGKGKATSDMAIEAAKRCLDSRGIVATDSKVVAPGSDASWPLKRDFRALFSPKAQMQRYRSIRKAPLQGNDVLITRAGLLK